MYKTEFQACMEAWVIKLKVIVVSKKGDKKSFGKPLDFPYRNTINILFLAVEGHFWFFWHLVSYWYFCSMTIAVHNSRASWDF